MTFRSIIKKLLMVKSQNPFLHVFISNHQLFHFPPITPSQQIPFQQKLLLFSYNKCQSHIFTR